MPAVAVAVAAALALSFLGSRQVHRNYLVWLLPLMALGLACSVWGREEEDQGPPKVPASPSTKNSL